MAKHGAVVWQIRMRLAKRVQFEVIADSAAAKRAAVLTERDAFGVRISATRTDPVYFMLCELARVARF